MPQTRSAHSVHTVSSFFLDSCRERAAKVRHRSAKLQEDIYLLESWKISFKPADFHCIRIKCQVGSEILATLLCPSLAERQALVRQELRFISHRTSPRWQKFFSVYDFDCNLTWRALTPLRSILRRKQKELISSLTAAVSNYTRKEVRTLQHMVDGLVYTRIV